MLVFEASKFCDMGEKKAVETCIIIHGERYQVT